MSTTDEFFNAISAGDVDELARILEQDPSLAGATHDGMGPVRAAALAGHPELAEPLRRRGVPTDIFDASAIGDVDAVRNLLDADPDQANAHDHDGFTALHQAAWFGRLKVAELLLARGADPRAVAQNDTGLRPINSAAAGGHPVIVHLLLDRGAEVDDAQAGGITPLHVAAGRNDVAMVTLLLGRGADPALVSASGRTAADYTVDPDVAALLP